MNDYLCWCDHVVGRSSGVRCRRRARALEVDGEVHVLGHGWVGGVVDFLLPAALQMYTYYTLLFDLLVQG